MTDRSIERQARLTMRGVPAPAPESARDFWPALGVALMWVAALFAVAMVLA